MVVLWLGCNSGPAAGPPPEVSPAGPEGVATVEARPQDRDVIVPGGDLVDLAKLPFGKNGQETLQRLRIGSLLVVHYDYLDPGKLYTRTDLSVAPPGRDDVDALRDTTHAATQGDVVASLAATPVRWEAIPAPAWGVGTCERAVQDGRPVANVCTLAKGDRVFQFAVVNLSFESHIAAVLDPVLARVDTWTP